MIGFVSAISSALAVIILVVIASLLGYIQSILPPEGLVKISDVKYRYIMEGYYLNDKFLQQVVVEMENLGFSERVISYQTGCNYGFNTDERQMTEIPTFNYILLGQYFGETIPIESIIIDEQKNAINNCFIDINLSERES
jgi:hypothetical protein